MDAKPLTCSLRAASFYAAAAGEDVRGNWPTAGAHSLLLPLRQSGRIGAELLFTMGHCNSGVTWSGAAQWADLGAHRACHFSRHPGLDVTRKSEHRKSEQFWVSLRAPDGYPRAIEKPAFVERVTRSTALARDHARQKKMRPYPADMWSR